jgi:hypothetical protein
MGNTGFDWVDQREEEIKDEKSKTYFDIKEGSQTFILLSHCAPLAQVFDPATKKYRPAEEGDRNVSIKGVCWVFQEGVIKQAKLPYTVVKSIRALQQNADWEFKVPFEHPLTLTTVGAKTKEVEYTLTASPKKIVIPPAILEELKQKPSPEEVVDRIKGKAAAPAPVESKGIEYPAADIDPNDIPF